LLNIFSTRILHSHRNGEIVVKRGWGKPEIEVGGYVQSGTYMKLLWRAALQHTASTVPVRNVLLLGLGGGSAIGEIHTCFPGCRITVLEWDKAMVELAHRFKLYPPSLEPMIILGDAIETLLQLTDSFDLVLIDIFKGNVPEPRLHAPETIASLANLLAPSGQVILNAFEGVRLMEAFARQLDYQLNWKFRANYLALYRRFLEPGSGLASSEPPGRSVEGSGLGIDRSTVSLRSR